MDLHGGHRQAAARLNPGRVSWTPVRGPAVGAPAWLVYAELMIGLLSLLLGGGRHTH
jgi:hypothetical protein